MNPRDCSREPPNLGNPGPSADPFFRLMIGGPLLRPLVEEQALR